MHLRAEILPTPTPPPPPWRGTCFVVVSMPCRIEQSRSKSTSSANNGAARMSRAASHNGLAMEQRLGDQVLAPSRGMSRAASRDGPAMEHRLRATASRWRGLASNYQRPRASNAPERLPGHPKWSPGLPPGSILELWGSRSPQGTKNHQHRSYLGPISCPFGARMNHTIPNDCWTGMYRFYEDSEFGLHMASKG